MTRARPPNQLDLFAAPPAPELDFTAERALADRIPSHVFFGTSSWTFPGWSGVVYPPGTTQQDLLSRGLELYARHPLLRTVGIDSSYYRPLDEAALGRYSAQLPDGFRCVMKVWNEITSAVMPRGTERNPHFLDPSVFVREVTTPLERAFSGHAGPLVLEFPPSTGLAMTAGRFAELLDGFLAKAPKGFDYAVELRNRELLTFEYLDVLARHGAAHVLNFWESMPEIGVQLDLPGVLSAPFVVSRLLIPPGRRYEARKEELAPFDRLVDPQEGMRADIVRLADECRALGKVLFVIVNNKAEGSSPLSVVALAERLAKRPG